MAISYNCGDCAGTGKQNWSPYDNTPCVKCEGRGFVYAGRHPGPSSHVNGSPVAAPAYDKQGSDES